MKCVLGDIAFVTMGQSPKSEFYNSDRQGIPFLQGNRTFGKRFPKFDTYTTMPTKIAKAGDVIMSVRAPVGDLNYTPVDMCLGRGVCAIRMKNGNQDFLFYLLKYYMPQLLNKESGTVFGSVNRNDIMGLEVDIPSNAIDQQRIARFLTIFDEKIDTIDKINENLEQQLHAIYTQFLTDHQTFPVTVEDVVLTANTGADAIQKAPIVDYDTGVRCVRVGDMSNRRPVHEWGFTKVTPEIFKQYQLHKDDIVITRTASLGLNRLISEDLNAVYNNGLIRISINSDIAFPLIVYRQLQTNDYRNYISRISGETSVRPNMKINYLLKYSFDILGKSDQMELMQLFQPLFVTQERNISEVQLLSSLRDALLPRLMSGELDVSNLDI